MAFTGFSHVGRDQYEGRTRRRSRLEASGTQCCGRNAGAEGPGGTGFLVDRNARIRSLLLAGQGSDFASPSGNVDFSGESWH